ncbi:MAG: isoprenylcysteine carboxylmethyltransferase family protein [Alphaproteobacteria bacterium]
MRLELAIEWWSGFQWLFVPWRSRARLRWWARFHLGPLWSATITRKDDHKIIDTGPYARVRHPIYTDFVARVPPRRRSCRRTCLRSSASRRRRRLLSEGASEEEFLRQELGQRTTLRRARSLLVPKIDIKLPETPDALEGRAPVALTWSLPLSVRVGAPSTPWWRKSREGRDGRPCRP